MISIKALNHSKADAHFSRGNMSETGGHLKKSTKALRGHIIFNFALVSHCPLCVVFYWSCDSFIIHSG